MVFYIAGKSEVFLRITSSDFSCFAPSSVPEYCAFYLISWYVELAFANGAGLGRVPQRKKKKGAKSYEASLLDVMQCDRSRAIGYVLTTRIMSTADSNYSYQW